MPMEISQLRPEGVSAAVEFAGQIGCKLDEAAVDTRVSLIAREENVIVAAILGVHAPGAACELHVCLSKPHDTDHSASDLINKVLMKVRGEGIRRCQICYHGPDEAPTNWPGERWTGQEEQNASEAA